MTTYTCPTCNESMPRDLLLFVRHTDVHIQEAQEAALSRKSRPVNRLAALLFHHNSTRQDAHEWGAGRPSFS